MNGKKIIVALLFILTIIIGIAAVYFATTLKPKTTVTPTPTPLIILTNTPIPLTDNFDITPIVSNVVATQTPTPEIGSLTCGQPCDKGACLDGFHCINVNSEKKCVSNSCVTLQNGVYIPNGLCEADLCKPNNSITLVKTSKISCMSGQDTRKISFSIKITNPVGITNPRTKISVTDILNTNLKDDFITESSISNNGKLVNGQIKWTDLTLDANGGSLELHYDAVVPSTENSKSYSNTVSVYEVDTLKNQFNYEYTVNILPCTALISDEVDRLLIGTILLIFGVFIYRMNWHLKLGKAYTKLGGDNINQGFKNLFFEAVQKDTKKFERKVITDRENN
jgi:hypothetical protein